MKTKLLLITLICNLTICNFALSQNITNTLGSNGTFTIKNGPTNYFTLTQSTGQVNIINTLRLENTSNSTTGIIFKGTNRFIHNYGANNTFVGVRSGNFTFSGTGNTGIGDSALSSLTSGGLNSALGYLSLYKNTTGIGNSAFGVFTLINNTIGNDNSAFGVNSLDHNNDGSENSAFGSQSLHNNSSGADNSAFGYQSLIANSTGSNNSAFGDYSLRNAGNGDYNSAFGSYSLFQSSGDHNTALGDSSLYNLFSGNNNLGIGYNAQVPTNSGSNQVRIGNTAITYAGIQVAWTITSDKRWKSNIKNSNLGLDFINKLNPVSYTRNNDEKQKSEYGFIAQELEGVLKDVGADNSGMITVDDNGMYELRYNDLLAPMVKSIQELSQENDKLKKENENLINRLTKLEELVKNLTNSEQLVNTSDQK